MVPMDSKGWTGCKAKTTLQTRSWRSKRAPKLLLTVPLPDPRPDFDAASSDFRGWELHLRRNGGMEWMQRIAGGACGRGLFIHLLNSISHDATRSDKYTLLRREVDRQCNGQGQLTQWTRWVHAFSCIISVIVASSATNAGTEDQGIWSQKYARELHMDVAVSISLLTRDHQWPGSFSSGASCFTVSSASGTGRRNWKGDS